MRYVFAIALLGACRLGFEAVNPIADGEEVDARAYADVILADTPIAYFRFEETSGTIAIDSSASNLVGMFKAASVLGVPGLVPNEPSSRALELAAAPKASNFVEVANTPVLEPAAGVTIEAWVRPRSVSFHPIVTLGESYQFFVNNDGRLYSWINLIGPVTTTSPVVAVGTTHHVAMTFDNSTVTLYADGVIAGQQAITASFGYTHTDFLAIGGDFTANSGPSLDGFIDEVVIYGSALRPDQILAHMTAGR